MDFGRITCPKVIFPRESIESIERLDNEDIITQEPHLHEPEGEQEIQFAKENFNNEEHLSEEETQKVPSKLKKLDITKGVIKNVFGNFTLKGYRD